MKKYEFTGEKKGKLNRIRAVMGFGNVIAGDIGGWIEKDENLSHYGSAWVSGDAQVYGYAKVYGDAQVSGVMRSDGYCFCYVPDAEGVFRVIAGCRYFTMDEAKEHWQKTRGGTPLGAETMAILDAFEALQKVKPEGCV
jgi:hypothetical protein